MDDRGAEDSRHDAGPRGGPTATAHARGGAEQAIEVAHSHAQPGTSLLDQSGNCAPRHDAGPRPRPSAEATSQLSAKQTACVGTPVPTSALPLVEAQRTEIIGPSSGRRSRP